MFIIPSKNLSVNDIIKILDDIYTSEYTYIIPYPVQDAWRKYQLMRMTNFFDKKISTNSVNFQHYYILDNVIEIDTIRKKTINIIRKYFHPVIVKYMITHPKIGNNLKHIYNTMISILLCNKTTSTVITNTS